jgi:hypothetical protein
MAQVRIVTGAPHPTDLAQEEKVTSPAPSKTKQVAPDLKNLKKKFLKNALSGSVAVRWLDASDFTFDNFNARSVSDIEEAKNRDIVVDYSVMYQYRPMPSYSIGLSFDRLQVDRTKVDLRYIPTTTPLPSPSTNWEKIASDINASATSTGLSVEPTAVGNFYQPEYIRNRGYAYEFVARAYIYPSAQIDPFLQATVGWTHNRAAVVRSDGSANTSNSDKAWTWSIAAGGSYPLNKSLFLESCLQLRDQHGFDYQDTLESYTTPTTSYTLSGSCAKYYSVDLKITLRQTW